MEKKISLLELRIGVFGPPLMRRVVKYFLELQAFIDNESDFCRFESIEDELFLKCNYTCPSLNCHREFEL